MTPTIKTLPRRAFPLLLATLALSAGSWAQESTPSPSASPAPKPSPEGVVVVVPEPIIKLDAARLQAEVGRATAEARRVAEVSHRSLEANRVILEREARRIAQNAAKSDQVRASVSAGVRAATEQAMWEAHIEREAAVRESLLDAREAVVEAEEERRESQQDARERAREAEQNRREREREKRHSEQDKHREGTDRADDLYEQAMESIDEEDWDDALRPLNRLISLNSRVDAALYWASYVQGKLNHTAAALTSLARLQKEFPTSRWAKEGKALEMEVRGKSGQTPRPEQLAQDDDLDLKLMALSALSQSDPQEALPLLAKILTSPTSPRKIRERSLFVLAQIGSEEAGNAIAEVARGNSSPELQRKAIQYLGVFGGAGNRKVLSDIYASSTDNAIRKQILNSFMVSGDKARVLSAAKTEKDPTLRADAVRLLGVMGGNAELSLMYTAASTADEKKNILHALFIGGAVEPVAAAAKTEKDKEVRLSAVRNLGLMGRKSQDVLGGLYAGESDPEVKRAILNAFFLQNNSVRLVEIARAEKDPGLKKDAVHWLSLMNSKESRAYMMELLKE